MRISKLPSPMQIVVDQNKLKNVKYLICVAWQKVMQDAGYT